MHDNRLNNTMSALIVFFDMSMHCKSNALSAIIKRFKKIMLKKVQMPWPVRHNLILAFALRRSVGTAFADVGLHFSGC